ncbi:MAG: membrane protein insertase YidC [Muribaculaceae bacterium]|nr:membrane protein insertase YidC [Muribaculaceae bacterium]
MDKNTVTGLLLMAAVMFGFFWLTKPSEAEIAAEQERREQAANEALKEAQTQNEQAFASWNSVDSTAVAGAVKAMGSADAEGRVLFGNDNLRLELDSVKGLSGAYVEANDSLPIVELLSGKASDKPALAARASKALKSLVADAVKYEGFAKYLSGDNQDLILENELVKVTISSRGAYISQVELKKYTTEVEGDPTNILLFRDEADGYGFRFNTYDQRIDTRDFNFTPQVENDSVVTLILQPDAASQWAVRYTLAPDAYTVRMEVLQTGMASILPPNTSSMEFGWRQKMGRNELGRTFEERNSSIYYKYIGEGVDDLNANKDSHESLTGRLRWVAFKNQYFSSVIIARDSFTSAELSSTIIKSDKYLKEMTLDATLPYNVSDGVAASFDFYFGPNDFPILSKLDNRLGYDDSLSLTRLIPLGWGLFRWINTYIVIPVFTFLGSFLSNYGLIILLLTLFIKLIIFPFTFKSFKSQAKMRVLAPEIKAINEKYPKQEDAMKRQQETMALYSRVGASPFSGCLPMMLQMPVLIAMFSFFPSAIELRGQSFLWAHDLSAPDSILNLPFNIPFYGNHVSLFCLLMTIINIVYMKVSMQTQPQSADMPGMKMMQYLMPIMFLFIFNDYASGLSYYYLLSLLITIIQTYVFRRIIDEKKVREQLLENARKPRKKSGWMARLEEAQRQAEAMQRQQQKNRRR